MWVLDDNDDAARSHYWTKFQVGNLRINDIKKKYCIIVGNWQKRERESENENSIELGHYDRDRMNAIWLDPIFFIGHYEIQYKHINNNNEIKV